MSEYLQMYIFTACSIEFNNLYYFINKLSAYKFPKIWLQRLIMQIKIN